MLSEVYSGVTEFLSEFLPANCTCTYIRDIGEFLTEFLPVIVRGSA